MTINITPQPSIIETKVLPSKIIQSPPTIEKATYQLSEPVVKTGVTLQNMEQTQNFDLGPQFTEYVEETKTSTFSLFLIFSSPTWIVPPPKPTETVILKAPRNIWKIWIPFKQGNYRNFFN